MLLLWTQTNVKYNVYGKQYLNVENGIIIIYLQFVSLKAFIFKKTFYEMWRIGYTGAYMLT